MWLEESENTELIVFGHIIDAARLVAALYSRICSNFIRALAVVCVWRSRIEVSTA